MAASLRGQGNIWAGKRDKRADWVPDDIVPRIQDKAETLYFAGCTASYVGTDVAEATVRLLDKAGVEFGYMGPDEFEKFWREDYLIFKKLAETLKK